MKITKRQLKRIIREEKRRLDETYSSDEIKKLSKSEGRTISGQLRLVFEHYKKELTKKINTSP